MQRISAIRAILFDKDGTLLDFDATWRDFAHELAMEAAGGNAGTAAQILAGMGYDPRTSRFAAGSLFAAAANAEVIAALYPHLAGEELHDRIVAADRRAASVEAVALPGVVDAVRHLSAAGLRLGLATNDSVLGARRTLAAFGLTPFFDAVFGYDSVHRPKPAPDVVLAFAAAIGMEPGEIAMVGDNLHDLVAAREAGAVAIGVLSGNSRREHLEPLADLILDSVTDLAAILGEHRALRPTSSAQA